MVCLKAGRVFRDGSKEAVLRAEILRELFEVEAHVLRHGDHYLMH